jgi:uncharacterized protein YbjQ (UPF0145 family)
MAFFHHKQPDGQQVDPAVAAAEMEASLAALARGGIPPKAERRLAGLRQGDKTLFTSDLTVAEFALITKVGLQPVCQVMGSSVYHVGWQGMPSTYFGIGRGSYELSTLSGAWNSARRLALSRLQQEAALAGADAVVGVHIGWGAHDFAPSSVEMVAVGTAVRTSAAQRTNPPILTDLSGQELYNLLSAGYRPVGVVGATTIFYVVPQWSTQTLTSGWGQWSNAELPDFSQAIYTAREVAFSNINTEAQTLGGHGVIGVSLRQQIQTREVDQGNNSRRIDLIVTMHVLGTAIVEGQGTPVDVHTNLDLSVS